MANTTKYYCKEGRSIAVSGKTIKHRFLRNDNSINEIPLKYSKEIFDHFMGMGMNECSYTLFLTVGNESLANNL